MSGIINCTINYQLFTNDNDGSDGGIDTDIIPLVGDVELIPQTTDHRPVQVPGLSLGPAGVMPRRWLGRLDTEGKLRDAKTNALGVRVWANDPILGLDRLIYRVVFHVRTPRGEEVRVDGGYFEVPSTDQNVDLSNVLTSTGSTIAATVREKGYAEDIIDSGVWGRDVVRTENLTEFWSILGTIPTGNLPSYVDDILEFANLAAFPATGESGKIYVAIDTGNQYRWSGSMYVPTGDKTTAAGITDSTATGRAIVTGDDAAGRRALGVSQVFDARNYGVIADGAQHNNVANLLDCFAAAAAAGGGEVVLPAGVIDTSEAVMGATVTAASGNTYTINGGIPLPSNTPMLVRGQGMGVTTLKLSKGMVRAFDFYATPGNKSWRDITIRDLTVDRGHITGLTIGPLTALTLTDTLTMPSSGWVTLPGVSAADFANARYVYFPATNAGTLSGYNAVCRISGGQVQVIAASNPGRTLLPGDKVQGALYDHTVLGNLISNLYTSVDPWGSTFERILVENVEAINGAIAESSLVTTTGRSTAAYKYPPDNTGGIYITLVQEPSTPSVKAYATDITFRNVRIYGTGQGFRVAGGGFGTWMDEVWAVDCYHDTLVPPTGQNWEAINYQFGSRAQFGRGGLIRCVGRRSGDVGLEVDNAWRFYCVDNRWEETVFPIYRSNIAIPSATIDGPPTTELSGGAIASNAGTMTVAALPASAPRSGLALIETSGVGELVWYKATNVAGTSWTLWRGLNGTTPAAHNNGDKVTFIDLTGQRHYDIRSSVFMKDVLALNDTRAFLQTESSYLGARIPLPSLTVRDAKVVAVGGNITNGQLMDWRGWQPELDMQGVKFSHSGLNAADRSTGCAAIKWVSTRTVPLYDNAVPCPAPRIYGRNNEFVIHGSLSGTGTSNLTVVSWGAGWAKADFEFAGEIAVSGASAAKTYLCFVAPYGSSTKAIFAKGSRIGVTGKTLTGVGGDNYPVGIYLESTTYVALDGSLGLDLDLSDFDFSTVAADGGYIPWIIDSTQANNIRFGRIAHPKKVTRGYPSSVAKTVRVSSNYSVGADDEIVLVDTTAGPITITLPWATGGHSSATATIPLTRGRMLRIVDASLTANTNNITITPQSGEKIDRGSAGSSRVLSTQGASIHLTALHNLPGWISSSASVLTPGAQINGVLFDGSTSITVADNTKEPAITAGTTTQWWRGDKTWQSLAKTDVGLSNVDNTADSAKPVSTAQQTALDLKANAASPALTGTVNIAQSGMLSAFNTADQATNYEKLGLGFDSNVAKVFSGFGGTGTYRDLQFGVSTTAGAPSNLSRYIKIGVSSPFITLRGSAGGTSNVTIISAMTSSDTISNTAGIITVLAVAPTINQASGTGGYTALLINPTETAAGSGTKRLIDAQVGGTSKFTVDNTGTVSVSGTTATVRAGTGSPESAVTAAVGSMYLRTDGGAGTTLYIKESGSGNTGWVAK